MIVYSITCKVTDKIYIGQTIRRFSERKGLHLFHLRNNQHSNPHLQNSFNKYGEDNFYFKIEDEATSIRKLNALEKTYISRYSSLDRKKGFNLRSGGKNDHLSEDHKGKISEALKGNTNGLTTVPDNIHQYTLKGKLVKVWKFVRDIVEYYDLPNSGRIYQCCKGKRNKYKGYIWRFPDSDLPLVVPKRKGKSIVLIKNNKIINLWSRLKDCALYYNTTSPQIIKKIKNKKTIDGGNLMYKKMFDNENKTDERII